jgi:hypothetical protein
MITVFTRRTCSTDYSVYYMNISNLKQLHKMLKILKIINCCKLSDTLKQVLLQNEGHSQFSLLSAAVAYHLTAVSPFPSMALMFHSCWMRRGYTPSYSVSLTSVPDMPDMQKLWDKPVYLHLALPSLSLSRFSSSIQGSQ